MTHDPKVESTPEERGFDDSVSTSPKRRQLLEAALSEFSAFGVAGARVERIARRAGCNKQLIYHYFGGKDGLARTVFTELLASSDATLRANPPANAAELVEEAFCHVGAEKQEWVRALLWEALESPSELLGEDVRRQHLENLTEMLAFVDDDELRPYVALAFIAMSMFPWAVPQVARLITGLQPSDPAFADRYRRAMRMLVEPRAEPRPVRPARRPAP